MCFVPQRRARLRHRSFQKWSKRGVFTILTSNCASRHNGVHFSASQLPKVLRSQGVGHPYCQNCSDVRCFNFLASRSASRVQFVISHLPRWLRIRRFSEPTFWPSGATKHWNLKNTVFWCVLTLFYLFAHLDLLSSLIFFLHLSSAFLFSDSSHLCFSICPYCWKLDF